MKVRSLFDLINDARDIVEFFDNVETPEQMISALERLKKREPDDFLISIEALRLSLESALSDTLELGRSVEDDEEEGDDAGEEFDEKDLELLDEKTEEKPEEKPAANVQK